MPTLSRFPVVMDKCVRAVISVTEAMRKVRDGSGDLPWRDLHAIQSGLEAAKRTTYEVLGEAAKAPTASESYMVSVNGPATIAAFQAQAVTLEFAAADWNVFLSAQLANLTGPELISLVLVDVNNIQTKKIAYVDFIPAAKAQTLRSSAELAALIAGFEAVGA